ncbi:hypothetical protein LRP52_29005 [Photobacterium sp. ZSDE20]|uniref:Uncharacterized protein n=1 Tax=Photobacterium pectinilyticum TaxID=2906793 RepID=A0ABT1N6U7_9GAMM|nr:hypothetical protein [Photobacterium sp. ZSDE20]MCQ1060470.1 hypothetical protein [Photobacterium sp. ZSDE20]MDD1826220.1 hypothetical protein [Photobacterium sp. ZSDE20]
MKLKDEVVGVKAEVIAPFFYHSVPTESGSATITECISDTAFNFAIASTLGMLNGPCLPETVNYHRDIVSMPFRSSVLLSDDATLSPIQVRRLNLDAEAGIDRKINDGKSKGNYKDYYSIQQVSLGATYEGAIFGLNPFKHAGRDKLVVRVGGHRQGMLLLTPTDVPDNIYLNAYTAGVFEREIAVSRYLLHTIQLSQPFTCREGLEEVRLWR